MQTADHRRAGRRRRALRGLLKSLALLVAVYFVLGWLGFKIARTSRVPVPLSGSALETSRATTGRLDDEVRRPANLIVVVADGLGFAHLAAARAALHGMGGSAAWDRFPVSGWHQPHSATGFLVDSAGSATALATGVPTHNDRLSVDIDGRPLETLFERATARGYRTGVVTDSYVWDATPAAFVVHSASRDDAASILRQLGDSELEILVGELEDLGEGEVPEREPTLALLASRFRLFGPDAASTEEFLGAGHEGGPVAAIFDEDQVTDLRSTPSLPPLLGVALRRLASDERPFLLLVESEEADSASHSADLGRLLRGMEVIEAALHQVLDFAAADGETLVLFTSDHETGGLALSISDNTNKKLKALWPTTDHTGVVVPLFAAGPGAEAFDGFHFSWEVGRRLREMLDRPPPAEAASSTGATAPEPGD